MISRLADNSFWIGRYVERAENLARIIDVNETYARDGQGAQEWRSIVTLHADDATFYEKHGTATAEAVIYFYVLDRDNPSSIVSSIAAARENARSLRHMISTEVWTHLNVLHTNLRSLTARDLRLTELSRLLGTLKQECQAHTGIVEGTLYRDEVWCYWQIGKMIERADQTTRLLDIKYMDSLPEDAADSDVVTRSQWDTLLRSAAGYHAFRRIWPQGLTPENIVNFLLFDRRFPRSALVSLDTCSALFRALEREYGLRRVRDTRRAAEAFRKRLSTLRIKSQSPEEVHGLLDEIQVRLATLSEEFRRSLFDR